MVERRYQQKTANQLARQRATLEKAPQNEDLIKALMESFALPFPKH